MTSWFIGLHSTTETPSWAKLKISERKCSNIQLCFDSHKVSRKNLHSKIKKSWLLQISHRGVTLPGKQILGIPTLLPSQSGPGKVKQECFLFILSKQFYCKRLLSETRTGLKMTRKQQQRVEIRMQREESARKSRTRRLSQQRAGLFLSSRASEACLLTGCEGWCWDFLKHRASKPETPFDTSAGSQTHHYSSRASR